MIVYNDPSHRNIIAKSANTTLKDGDPVIGRVRDGKLLGGCVYDNYTGSSICIHVAGFHPHWLNRELLVAVFAYPFLQLGVKVLFGPTPASNIRACKMNIKYGFEPKYRIEDVFPSGDMILFAMRKDGCRFIKPDYINGHR